MDKIREIIKKEWSEVFKNRLVLGSVILMPLVFTIMPLVILRGMQSGADVEMADMASGLPDNFSLMCEGLSSAACGQFFVLLQFLSLFLLMPMMIPVTIASYSIVGEKNTRTLEPVLATPITTLELLLGKALAGVIPALTITWFSYGVFVMGTSMIATDKALVGAILSPIWLIAIFVISALLSVAGVSLSIMISSRVNDPRAAEQLSSLVVIPLLAVFMGQSFGFIQFDLTLVVWAAFGMLLLDVVLMYFAIQLFQRETILTRWK
ncbi:MAG: ABC transporter permease subunit [Anaerolineales bacterium]|nr:ABC transporter permease subunit [Anaerolineales bacterium]